MALSGSYNFSQNRNELILDAFQQAGIIDFHEQGDVEQEMINSASRTLNRMIKAWTADGLQVWKQKPMTLLLEKGKGTYNLGPTGDHWVESYTETAMRVAASSTDTTMEVDSTTGMTAGDYVGVVVDDGTIHWTTVASVTDGDTFELTTGLDDDAAVDNAVYFYTNKGQRPYRIIEGVRRDSSNNDTTVTAESREEYWNGGNKSESGKVNNIFYDQGLTNGKLYCDNLSDNSTDSLELIAHYPFQDLDTSTDNFDFPDYWYEALLYGLADRLCIEYKVDRPTKMDIRQKATEAKEKAMNFDVENVSVFFQPERRH